MTHEEKLVLRHYRHGLNDAEIMEASGLTYAVVRRQRRSLGLPCQPLAWQRRYRRQMIRADADHLVDLRHSRGRVAALLAGLPHCGAAHLRLLEHLRQQGPCLLPELVAGLGRSAASVRRLLAALRHDGAIDFYRRQRQRVWFACEPKRGCS